MSRRAQLNLFLFLTLGYILTVSKTFGQSPGIQNNDYVIEVVVGPVLGSSQMLGMGGANTALAEGESGAPSNPASFASRSLFELDWFELGVGFSLFAPGVFGRNDFFNNEHGIGNNGRGANVNSYFFLNAGLRLQFGNFGFGLDFQNQTYTTNTSDGKVEISFSEGHLGGAYSFFEDRLVAGLALRLISMNMGLATDQSILRFEGNALEVGMLYKPGNQPWRLGLTGRLPVESGPGEGGLEKNGINKVSDFVLPRRIRMPWELQLGFAWRFGDRPMNIPWKEPWNPEPQWTNELHRLRKERATQQLLVEFQRKGLRPGAEVLKNGQPSDPNWCLAEKLRRQNEEKLFESRLEDARRAIELKRRQDYADLPRKAITMALDLVLIGPSQDAISIDGFLEQVQRNAGQEASLGLHLGLEIEPLKNLLKMRAGYYWEPSRVKNLAGRHHMTGGFEWRLFQWDGFGLFGSTDWKISTTFDMARGYVDLGVGLGVWH
jgi:hypothetical protein